ncbi:MAG: hypothetical protein QM538_05440 [Methylacidiphilales bacterium]|nr:hypothetical protein [Candidatus Methylacidiphilales bacterium]
MKWGNYLLLILVSVFAIWRFMLVSPSMDEFLPYHRIACTDYPFAKEHVYKESCTDYKNSILGISYYRNYLYSGAVSNIFYKPFYWFNQSKYSHYLYGIVALICMGWLISRIFLLQRYLMLLPICYTPLLYQSLHDAGPIRFALVAHFLLIMLIVALFNELKRKKQLLIGVGVCMVVAIAIEDKPFFLYLIPQILILVFVVLNYKKYQPIELFIKSNLQSCVLLIGAIAIAMSVTLLFTQVYLWNGKLQPYIVHLLSMLPDYERGFGRALVAIVTFTFTPLNMADRGFEFTLQERLISTLAFCPLLFIAGKQIWITRHSYGRYLALAFGATSFIYFVMKNVHFGHHLIFLHVPMIIALMLYANASWRSFIVVLASMTLVVVVTSLQLTFAEVRVEQNPEREELFKYLQKPEIARNAVINFSSWGGYYQQSLYGDKNQLVTYIDPLNAKDVFSLEETRIKLNRSHIINICIRCTREELQKYFNAHTIIQVGPPTMYWRMWKLSY